MSEPRLDGRLLYEYTARFTDVHEYGVSLADVLAGKRPPQAEGLRVDIAFAGEVQGELAGSLRAVDHLNVRADGRMELDIKGHLTTPSGESIAFAAGGVAIAQAEPGRCRIHEHVRLTSAHPAHAWLNTVEIWAVGSADVTTGTVHIRGYVPA